MATIPHPPPLYGLILAGGKSLRMGTDKAALSYRGKTEPSRLSTLLLPYCEQVFQSVSSNAPSGPGRIPDTIPEIGPMGGILSAMDSAPDVGWLVVACDMPFLDTATLEHLVSHRAPEKPATCFTRGGQPEPLCAIYEPGIAPHLRASVAAKAYSLRRVLDSLDVALPAAPRPEALRNINARADFELARRQLEEGD